MSTLPDFTVRNISVTLTGAEWFALIMKITNPSKLNLAGVKTYDRAAEKLTAQIGEENARAETVEMNARWHTVAMDDSIEMVDHTEAPVFSVVCLPGDGSEQVDIAVNFAAHSPIFFNALLRVRAGIVEDFPDMAQDPDTSQAAWIAEIDAALRDVVTP